MLRTVLRDDQCRRIEGLLPGKSTDCGVTAGNNRLFVEAVLWMIRTGSPCRDLPDDFGYWHRVYVRYHRWCKKDVWVRIFEMMADDPDLDYLTIDGRVRVHQHGAAKKRTSKRSRR